PTESAGRHLIPIYRPADQERLTPGRLRPLRATALIGLGMTLVVVCAALMAPILPLPAYDDQDLGRSLLPPFWMAGTDPTYLLGTDFLGRDLLARLIYAARTSLLVGSTSVFVGGVIGVPLGLIAG